jgi:hypothetical protein
MLQRPKSLGAFQKERKHWRELIHHLVHKRDYKLLVKEDVVVVTSPDGTCAYTLPKELYEDSRQRRAA